MTISAWTVLLCLPGAQVAEPVDVTDATRGSPEALARLQASGEVVFSDGFESEVSLQSYFQIRGRKEGRVAVVTDAARARAGEGFLRCAVPDAGGKEAGCGVSLWLGDKGHDRLHFRRYVKFAADYDQGNLHHVGGGLAGVAGSDKWGGMGKAGERPEGDDRFSCSLEPWRAWGRLDPPGYLFLYAYWMDMKGSNGKYWGNSLRPPTADRSPLERDRWYCLEQMIKANEPGKADGEAAAWLDGTLILHYTGIRWRNSEAVRLKRASLGLYIHASTRENVVFYDDVVLSTGYVGPIREE